MKLRRLNFNEAGRYDSLHSSVIGLILFIKPLGSVFHRVFTLPKKPEEKIAELKQALSDLCDKEVKGIWFFDLKSEVHEKSIYDILIAIGFSPISVKLDNDPEVSN